MSFVFGIPDPTLFWILLVWTWKWARGKKNSPSPRRVRSRATWLLSYLALLSYLDLRSKFYKDLWSFGGVRGSKSTRLVRPSMRVVPLWSLLGASCWLIFRWPDLSWPVLASFWALLNLSNPIFIDFLQFFEPPSPPRTWKINEKPLIFLGFSLFSYVA